VRIARAAYSLLADLIVLEELPGEASDGDGGVEQAEEFARLAAMPRQIDVAVSPAGKRRVIPTGYEQTVPGTMVMFTLLVLTTSGAVLLVIERRQGLLRRLAFAPIERWQITLGKWIGKMGLGLVQIAFAMLVGATVFRVGFGPSFPMVCVLLFSYAGAMASTGMLLGCVARTEAQAVAVGVISANVLGALGGCWWPIEVTPEWMQKLALFLPTGWAMHGLHRLMSFAAGAASAVPHAIALSVLALVLGAVSARLFRFE
jgi:ABC-type multidrug transport system permease subunit